MNNTKLRFEGAMIGLAIGDALGMPTEFLNPTEIQKLYGKIKGFKYPSENHPCKHLKAGQYTDDTQMTIRMAEAIIEKKYKFDTQNIMKHFVKWYKEDDMRAPGCACINAVCGAIPGPLTAGNGSAMRVLPIAFLAKTKEEIVEFAEAQSKLTHGDPRAHEGSIILAYILWELIKNNYTIKCNELLKSINMCEEFKCAIKKADMYSKSKISDELVCTKLIGNSGFVIDTIACSLYFFWKYLINPTKGMFKPAQFGNDSDTISAILNMLFGAKYGIEIFPKKLLQVENYDKLVNIADLFYTNHIN